MNTVIISLYLTSVTSGTRKDDPANHHCPKGPVQRLVSHFEGRRQLRQFSIGDEGRQTEDGEKTKSSGNCPSENHKNL